MQKSSLQYINDLLVQDDTTSLYSIQTVPNNSISQLLQQSDSSDASSVSEDPLKSFKTSRRYFEAPNPLVKCYNCNEFGHMSSSCPNPCVKVRCVYCGEIGHTAFTCKQVICHRCLGVNLKQIGHKVSECRGSNRDCFLCKRSGHSAKDCLTRTDCIGAKQEELVRCLDCREKGHANCSQIECKSKRVYCIKCGEKGHSLDECDNRHRTDYSRDVYHSKNREPHRDHYNSDHDRPPVKRERRYWDKVEPKSTKEINRKDKYHSKPRKMVYRGSASESSD